MATKSAPDRRHETLREIATKVVRTGVHPIDAKEMIASGAYEYVPEGEDASAAPAGETGAKTDTTKTDDPPADIALPTVSKLPAALAEMTDVAAIRAMQEKDQRATAQPLYDARLGELEPPTS